MSKDIINLPEGCKASFSKNTIIISVPNNISSLIRNENILEFVIKPPPITDYINKLITRYNCDTNTQFRLQHYGINGLSKYEAMQVLQFIADDLNGDWKVDWDNVTLVKYYICSCNGKYSWGNITIINFGVPIFKKDFDEVITHYRELLDIIFK